MLIFLDYCYGFERGGVFIASKNFGVVLSFFLQPREFLQYLSNKDRVGETFHHLIANGML